MANNKGNKKNRRRNKPNNFNLLVEQLFNEFTKIPDFSLTSTDQTARRAFNIVTFRIAEISSYKNLVFQHFVPATNKAIFDSQTEFQNSQYKTLLQTSDLDFKETLYDTIRLAYVGLFHKLENYVNDVAELTELIFGKLFETEGTVAKWAKEKYRFDIKNWQQFFVVHKINWVCNCVKHKDGFPVKTPKPLGYEFIDETQRIKLTAQDFKRDCEMLIKLYPIYLQAMFLFAQHKIATEKPLLQEDYEFSPSLY